MRGASKGLETTNSYCENERKIDIFIDRKNRPRNFRISNGYYYLFQLCFSLFILSFLFYSTIINKIYVIRWRTARANVFSNTQLNGTNFSFRSSARKSHVDNGEKLWHESFAVENREELKPRHAATWFVTVNRSAKRSDRHTPWWARTYTPTHPFTFQGTPLTRAYNMLSNIQSSNSFDHALFNKLKKWHSKRASADAYKIESF